MEKVYDKCCGIDVHKKLIVACFRKGNQQEVRDFGATTRELLELCDWLKDGGCEMTAMESTGSYWKPLYNILEVCELNAKSLCDFLEHIGSIIISYLNKHAFSVTEVFDRCETSERYSLLLFSFVVSQIPLGSIVCRWYRVIVEEPEMCSFKLLHPAVEVVSLSVVFAGQHVFVFVCCLFQDLIIPCLELRDLAKIGFGLDGSFIPIMDHFCHECMHFPVPGSVRFILHAVFQIAENVRETFLMFGSEIKKRKLVVMHQCSLVILCHGSFYTFEAFAFPRKVKRISFRIRTDEYYGPFCSSKPELEQHHSGQEDSTIPGV